MNSTDSRDKICPRFSIIIPTYNRCLGLDACLSAVAAQDIPAGEFEVLVVDDGGDVPVKDIVADHGKRINVRLLRQANLGPAAARNLGAAHADGEFLAFTDDDCQPATDWLKTLAQDLKENPEVVLGGRTVNSLDGNIYSTASQRLISYLYDYYNVDPCNAKFLASNNMIVRRSIFSSVGGFSQAYEQAAGEDRAFSDTCLKRGYRLLYDKSAIVFHQHPLSFFSFCKQHYYYGRAAYTFRLTRAAFAEEPIRVEPLRFYTRMFVFPYRDDGFTRSTLISLLLFVSQLANLAGFALAWTTHEGNQIYSP